MSQDYDAIVIGLGSAGATASATLAQAGKRVLALEAQDRVGGRVHTVPFGNGIVELGAEWIHGEQKNTVYEHALKHKIPLIPQGVDLIAYRSDGSKPDDDVQELVNLLVEQQQCDEMILPEEPGTFGDFVEAHIKQCIKERKPELLADEDFIEHLLELLNLLVRNHNAANDWKDVDAHDKYLACEGNLYMSWHKIGYKTFFDILLNTHNNGPGWPTLDIKLNTEVTKIEWPKESSEKVIVTCKDGATYTADGVIVTVSLGVLKERQKTLFKPSLPEEKVKSIERIAMGVMDKIELSFNENWWPQDSSFFGFLWKGEDKSRIAKEDYWMTQIFGASRPMGSNNVLSLWTSGEVGKLIETLPINEVKDKCWQLLQKFLGANQPVPEPADILRSTWYSNPYTRGSYTFDSVSCAPYPDSRQILATPLLDVSGRPCVLFAGEATHEFYFSTVHGASETGRREAKRLLNSLDK